MRSDVEKNLGGPARLTVPDLREERDRAEFDIISYSSEGRLPEDTPSRRKRAFGVLVSVSQRLASRLFQSAKNCSADKRAQGR